MVITEQHTKVLIIGAGPSGLMMAAQLLRNGIQPIIIDSKQGITNQSKALAVQARTLEIYRQMGIIEKVINAGKQAKGVAFYQEGEKTAALSLSNVGKDQTPFPFVFLFQQSKNEQVLLDYLTQNCCPVYWDTNLISLTQSKQQAAVKLQSGEEQINITADWVIGADGAHSAVRKQLQIPFKGDTYQHQFYLADVKVDSTLLDENVQLFLSENGFAGFFPLPEDDCYRIVGSLPDKYDQEKDLQLEDVLPDLDRITGSKMKIVKNNWFTIYSLHHRMADKFREQRYFLIGDAAHIHSPVGGQGMNTGLQDAYNLAWKLAGVVNKQLNEKILNSYAEERMPVAKTLLNTTDKIFTIIVSRKWFAGMFKKWVMPKLLQFVWKAAGLREAFFKRVSQTDISYRKSKINLHLSASTKIKAGDRLPYLKLFDEKKQQETDLHEWCSKPGFTLIVLGKLSETTLFAIAKWITQTYAGSLNFFYLPPSSKNLDVFNALGVPTNKSKAIVVRPDMHIGFINDVVDIKILDNYLQNVTALIPLNIL